MSGRLSSKIKKSIPIIENISIKVLIEAYKEVLVDGQYNLDWDEESFSAYLVKFMKKSYLRTKHNLTIKPEIHLQNEEELPIGDNHPKKAPRIDISITSWTFIKNEELEYFFEAKNLCQSNWIKKSGTNVSESYYTKRYIDTGIENFRTGRYYDGSLVGYVLQGNIQSIVDALNKRLSKSSYTISNIKKIKPVNGFTHIYDSDHTMSLKEELNIKHIFLKF